MSFPSPPVPGKSLDPSAQSLHAGGCVQDSTSDVECPGGYAKECECVGPIRMATLPLALWEPSLGDDFPETS